MCETQHNIADQDGFKTLMCRRCWRLKINLRRTFVLFRTPYICSNKLDVQETDFSFTQFYGSWNYFSRFRFTHGWDSRSRSLGCSDWIISFLTKTKPTKPKMYESDGETCRQVINQTYENKFQSRTPIWICLTLITFHQNGTHSGSNAVLYVFEDNEAVIKIISKGRSPTMRRVSRTHRVALDWLFDRINHDSKIQLRYIDTKHQLVDILTKGNFTRDEWNKLLQLFNISQLSSTCCTKNSNLIGCAKTMGKRMQEQKRTWKKWQNRHLQRWTCHLMFRQVPQPRKFRLHLKARRYSQQQGKPESRMRGNSKSDAASSSQVRLQDAYLGGLMDTSNGETCRYKKGIRYCGPFRIWNLELSRRGSLGETHCLWISYGENQCIQ